MEQKEAVLRFLKEQAFEPGDKLPKHLEEKKFEVADVQRCLLAWTEKLYHAGQSYRGWDFDNLEQRREQEVQEEGIRAEPGKGISVPAVKISVILSVNSLPKW